MKFQLGQLVATPGALRAFDATGESMHPFVARHLSGDWGEVDAEDWESNNRSLSDGTRLLSAYYLKDQTKIWIITEADRSVTTLLLPEEY